MKLSELAREAKYDDAPPLFSRRAKGQAATIRDGELTEEQIESFKTTFDGLQLFNRRSVNGGTQFVLRNGKGQFLQFVVAKEGGDFLIREFVIRDGKQ